MADNATSQDAERVRQIKNLLWGNAVKEDVFRRWAQGFYFSTDEPTALVQTEGGPCAVIAPVQAFILKQLLLEGEPSTWNTVDNDKQDRLLVQAATEIIAQAANPGKPTYCIVHTESPFTSAATATTENATVTENPGENADNPAENGQLSDDPCDESMETSLENIEDKHVDAGTVRQRILDSELFHSQLRILTTNSLSEVEKYLTDRIKMLKEPFGVLLLLYTVVCTKGMSGMRMEMSDPTEPVIDSTYGYGSQSLINLMLTGRAVGHVWDHDQDIGGLKLRGIDKQNAVGFLALLEHLRYCEVGAFLKSPSHPVWVLGSETHLTVLFSTDRRLVSPETPAEQARRVFKKFDPEGNNFISANLLQDVLEELGLCADAEYVNIMTKKLDNECLGIILLVGFMDEFFPEEPRTCPDTFPLYHYNGLPPSNPDNRLKYHIGQAVLLECNVKCILDSNPMLTVLQTKWPSIEIQWDTGRTPSLN